MKNDENWDGELRHLFVFDRAMLFLWFCVQPLQDGACVLSPEWQSWCCWSVESHAVFACPACVFIKHGSTKLGLHASDHTLVCLFININYQRFVCFFLFISINNQYFVCLSLVVFPKKYLKAHEESLESLQAFGICVWLWVLFHLEHDAKTQKYFWNNGYWIPVHCFLDKTGTPPGHPVSVQV